MIPIKKYKKCFITKEGKVIEYISIEDLESIIDSFQSELQIYVKNKLKI